MNRFFVDPGQVKLLENQITIVGDDLRHISKVLRLKVDDRVEVCDGAQMDYICKIQSISKDNILLSIVDKKESKGEPPIQVVLYQGIPKSSKMDLIIQKTVELGISEIVPVEMKRSVVRFKKDKDKQDRQERWQKIALEAAKQSKRGLVPRVHLPISFHEAVEDSQKNQVNIMAYEGEDRLGFRDLIKSFDGKNISRIGIWIGPEGGLDGAELEKAKKSNMDLISLGPRILRTETAGFTILNLIMYELGDL